MSVVWALANANATCAGLWSFDPRVSIQGAWAARTCERQSITWYIEYISFSRKHVGFCCFVHPSWLGKRLLTDMALRRAHRKKSSVDLCATHL